MFTMGVAPELADGVEAEIRGRNAAAKGIFVLVLNLSHAILPLMATLTAKK